MKNILLALLMVFVVPSLAFAQAGVGDKIPHDLSLKNADGVVKGFDDVKGSKGVVYVFVRSADWCPYCQVQLIDLRDDADEIVENGYNIVSVSYDDPAALKAFKDKYSFEYQMLSDERSEAIKAFGILNEDYDPDHFAYGVPHPHIYVVGGDKTILAVMSEDGYKDRPKVEAVLETIESFQ